MDISVRFIVPAVVFLLTLASGLWLSRAGKPLNTAIFTVHKLIALGAVVATAVQTYHALAKPAVPALPIVLIVLVGLCVVTLFATGALMSANKPRSDRLLILHKIAPIVAVVAGAATLGLLQ